MNTYGIIGFPLTHSFSKQYFTKKFEKEGITDVSFDEFPISSINDFPGLLKTNHLLKGLSVTIPYKEQVLKYVTHLSAEVAKIGATNCIKVRHDQLTAYNTDIIGFEGSFVKNLRPGNKKALVLGSGGSSKAIQYVLKKLGIDLLVVSRIKTSDGSNIQYDQITKEMMQEYSIIINCTPLGMSPGEDSFPPIPYSLLSSGHYLFDLVYEPRQTAFLEKGEKQGAVVKNGFEMLIIQAEANWKIWNEG